MADCTPAAREAPFKVFVRPLLECRMPAIGQEPPFACNPYWHTMRPPITVGFIMAKGLVIVRMLFLFAFVFAVGLAHAEVNEGTLSPAKSRNPQQHTNQSGTKRNDAERRTGKDRIFVRVIAPNKTETSENKKSGAGSENTQFNGVNWDAIGALISALATTVIAWFTFSLASSTKKLWGETRAAGEVAAKSAEAAEKAATAAERSIQVSREAYIASERPWVSVDAAIGSDLLKTSNGIEFGVTFAVTNHGVSPAINVHIIYEVVTVKIAPDQFSGVRQKITRLGTQTEIGEHMGIQLFPSEMKTINWKNTLSNEEIENALKSYKPPAGMLPSFFIVGSVFYKSAFDEDMHQTGFNYSVLAIGDPRYPTGSDVPVFTDAFPMERVTLQSRPYYKGTID